MTHNCPHCTRTFTKAGYAAYLRRIETRAALEAEVAGREYDVPERFKRAPGLHKRPAPIITYSGDEPDRRERHRATSTDHRAGRM